MGARVSLAGRLWREVTPTGSQTLIALAAATALVLAGRSDTVLRAIGVTPDGVRHGGEIFRNQFQVLLDSPVLANLVLITFWATIGMVAYLACWAVYAAWVEARNDVVISHDYANVGANGAGRHWPALGTKAICGVFLVVCLTLLRPALALAQLVAAPLFSNVTPGTIAGLLAAVVGLAAGLYAVLLGVQLTFTPWYEEEAFTD